LCGEEIEEELGIRILIGVISGQVSLVWVGYMKDRCVEGGENRHATTRKGQMCPVRLSDSTLPSALCAEMIRGLTRLTREQQQQTQKYYTQNEY